MNTGELRLLYDKITIGSQTIMYATRPVHFTPNTRHSHSTVHVSAAKFPHKISVGTLPGSTVCCSTTAFSNQSYALDALSSPRHRLSDPMDESKNILHNHTSNSEHYDLSQNEHSTLESPRHSTPLLMLRTMTARGGWGGGVECIADEEEGGDGEDDSGDEDEDGILNGRDALVSYLKRSVCVEVEHGAERALRDGGRDGHGEGDLEGAVSEVIGYEEGTGIVLLCRDVDWEGWW